MRLDPGKGRPRLTQQEQRELTRRALLAAALEEFVERGWEAASSERIARMAGVTAPALYRHFDGRDDLLLRALEAAAEEAPLPALPVISSVREALLFARQIVAYQQAEGADEPARWTMINARLEVEAAGHPELRPVIQMLIERRGRWFAEWLEAAARAEGVRLSRDALALVAEWDALAGRLAMLQALCPGLLPDSALTDALEAFAAGAVAPQPTAKPARGRAS